MQKGLFELLAMTPVTSVFGAFCMMLAVRVLCRKKITYIAAYTAFLTLAVILTILLWTGEQFMPLKTARLIMIPFACIVFGIIFSFTMDGQTGKPGSITKGMLAGILSLILLLGVFIVLILFVFTLLALFGSQ
ncbi:MAG: hypothetical protein LBH00_06925 [Planctomycetaceae bacterium]|jgi:hypothetical protein|nr:hypothetical protein [Planctomycetaceae bacterium]